jgi:hypothetical protein
MTATLTKAEAVATLTAHGYHVTNIKGCRQRTGTGYRVTGNDYTQPHANLGRLRQMATNLINGQPINA